MRKRNLIQRLGEPDQSYQQRQKVAFLQNAFEAAIRKMSAKIADYQLEDPLEAIVSHTNDIDLQGSDIDTFILNTLSEALIVDSVALMCDFNNDLKRPYLVVAPVDKLYCPVVLEENGRSFIKQVGVGFTLTIAEGEFGQKLIRGVRVYRHRPARCQEWHEIDGTWMRVGKEKTFSNAKGQKLQELPIVWLSLQKFPVCQTGTSWSLPLAQANFVHYNRESELDTAVSITTLPTPYRVWTGTAPDEAPPIPIGVNHCLELSQGMSVGYMEPSGSGLILADNRQKHREEMMNKLGENFVSMGFQNKTATQVLAETEDSRSGIDSLRVIVASAFQEVFKLWYEFAEPKYDRSSPNAQHPVLHVRDDRLIAANPSEVAATIEAITTGVLPPDVGVRKLLRGGFLVPEDFGEDGSIAMDPEEVEEDHTEEVEEIGYKQGDEG